MASASGRVHPSSAVGVVAAGFAALAVAMGIGRFAFTPVLPVMQADAGLSLAAGGWLATANYAGYLAGALLAMHVRVAPERVVPAGVAVIALVTAGMAVTGEFAVWVVLRAAAGVASAFVLVNVSAWSLAQLAALGLGALAGWVFAGVGAGIAFAGLLCLLLAHLDASSRTLWLTLGAFAGIVAVALVLAVHDEAVIAKPNTAPGVDAPSQSPGNFGAEAWLLVACYGVFGFGYIIPATFLPVMARDALAGAGVFGWVWPIFGGTAAASTLIAARASIAPRTAWAVSHGVMAAGIAAAALAPSLPTVILAAFAVGGTFMVITMVGLQEARAVARARARALIGAMTAAFAIGQIAGPVLVSVSSSVLPAQGFRVPLLAAAAMLVISAALLYRRANGDAAFERRSE